MGILFLGLPFDSQTILAAVAFATSLVITVLLFLSPLWLTLQTKKLQAVMLVNVVSATVLDVLITIALYAVLHRQRSGLKSTDNLTNGLMGFMITRGIVTTRVVPVLAQAATIFTYLAMPGTFVSLIFHLSTSKSMSVQSFSTFLDSDVPSLTADDIPATKSTRTLFLPRAVLTTLTSRMPPGGMGNKYTEVPGDTWGERAEPDALATTTTIAFQVHPSTLAVSPVDPLASELPVRLTLSAPRRSIESIQSSPPIMLCCTAHGTPDADLRPTAVNISAYWWTGGRLVDARAWPERPSSLCCSGGVGTRRTNEIELARCADDADAHAEAKTWYPNTTAGMTVSGYSLTWHLAAQQDLQSPTAVSLFPALERDPEYCRGKKQNKACGNDLGLIVPAQLRACCIFLAISAVIKLDKKKAWADNHDAGR
ncbi:hypothetical protein HETIRDRAFT_455733 [Heterobasidion irregulare TC 32-1]|uniref:DUF6534 domain-containing protein n=1 Tax=Heterobasidion irregulare (strain TC 32-1) TaxID=747525 RepID=W4JTH5_HETIT|nr:uncharacterized protein HETIRDRAFT_455733 [Heterobasidion irregulare TC 32-1]ETW76196.1 hypothetical protein HETIRDRAFT_455733 [Heterobasidion irregulare TC 32-1]